MPMRFFHRRLLLAVIAVVQRPRLTLAIAGVVLIGSIALAVMRLSISSDQNKLFSTKVQFFRDYLSFIERFPENEAIYILARARDPNSTPPVNRWTGWADATAMRLRPIRQYVRSVDAKVPI